MALAAATRRTLRVAVCALGFSLALVPHDQEYAEVEDVNVLLLQNRMKMRGGKNHQPSWASDCTGLDCLRRYIALEDPSYNWTVTAKQAEGTASNGVGWKAIVIDMTSQSWLHEDDISETLWRHPIVLIIPDNLVQEGTPGDDWCSLYISPQLGYVDVDEVIAHPKLLAEVTDVRLAAELATSTGTRSATLGGVPYEHLIYSKDTTVTDRIEDALVAWSRSYWETHQQEKNWLIEFPMTKAVVRAMDTLVAYSGKGGGGRGLEQFMVLGHSKRGFTTWRSSLDPRVKAIAPLSAPVNLMNAMLRQSECLGGSTNAVHDYLDAEVYFNVTQKSDSWRLRSTWEFSNLTDSVLMEEMERPEKLVLFGSSDEFFMPDTWRVGWPLVKGSKSLRIIPNAIHNFDFLGQVPTISSWFLSVMYKEVMPALSWDIDPQSGAITARQTAGTRAPQTVRLWRAQTCDGRRRDFRPKNLDQGEECARCGEPIVPASAAGATCTNTKVAWTSSPLAETAPGSRTWTAAVAPPADGGWAAFFLEFEFPGPVARVPGAAGAASHWRTTDVSVVPDTYPFQGCYPRCGDRLVLLDG